MPAEERYVNESLTSVSPFYDSKLQWHNNIPLQAKPTLYIIWPYLYIIYNTLR